MPPTIPIFYHHHINNDIKKKEYSFSILTKVMTPLISLKHEKFLSQLNSVPYVVLKDLRLF